MFSNYPTDDAGLNYYTCVTLLDITKTDTVHHYVNGMGGSEAEYNVKRNQHRNYQTMLQVIGLRCQAVYLSNPTMFQDEELSEFGTNFINGNVWAFSFGVEQEDIFALPNRPLGLLLDDMHNVPIITGLTETVNITLAMIDTVNDDTKNTIILN